MQQLYTNPENNLRTALRSQQNASEFWNNNDKNRLNDPPQFHLDTTSLDGKSQLSLNMEHDANAMEYSY